MQTPSLYTRSSKTPQHAAIRLRASMLLRMTRWVVVDVATYFFGFVSPAPELAWLRLRADVLLYAVGFCCCGCRVTVFVSVILEG
jgi:hypothetical protein